MEKAADRTCSVKGCGGAWVAWCEVEEGGQTRDIFLCQRHVPLAAGGAIFADFLKAG